MGSRLSKAFKKTKKIFIVGIILWILISIVLIAPITVSIVETQQKENFVVTEILVHVTEIIGDVSVNIRKAVQPDYIKTFIKGNGIVLMFLILFATVGFLKAIPKSEYEDIEHGSSDWAKGEEYKVLSKHKGILLAEKHYLPVNKRGNVNVLVVGRFRFW